MISKISSYVDHTIRAKCFRNEEQRFHLKIKLTATNVVAIASPRSCNFIFLPVDNVALLVSKSVLSDEL